MFLHGRCDLGPALFVSVERKRKCLAKKTLHCTHTPSWIKNGNEDVYVNMVNAAFGQISWPEFTLLREKLYRTYRYIRTRELTRRAVHGGDFCHRMASAPPAQIARSAYQSGELKIRVDGGKGLGLVSRVRVVWRWSHVRLHLGRRESPVALLVTFVSRLKSDNPPVRLLL
ncbi:hypothetical protein GGP41_007563 [Bipolaris sorokiniana]|uniref:Uncharacterized protein n=1 Tax=Cochliobolus sativus TaxID=45130 RepID=A0A8H5ZAU6_COCSA|nr:hypothetical protein GGP41_007563 [Bipolaris sorokiniana]